MDQKLRDEFRAYKAETDDRLNRLEAALKALTEPKSYPADDGSLKVDTKAAVSEAKKA